MAGRYRGQPWGKTWGGRQSPVSRPTVAVRQGINAAVRVAGQPPRVVDLLMSAVGGRVLAPGGVYTADAIGDQLRLGRRSVRDAMIELASEGVVEVVSEHRFRIGAPTVAELREMIEIRVLLEVPAIRRVAERGLSDADLEYLHSLADRTLEAARSRDVLRYINADMDLHLELVRFAGNDQTVEVVRVLRSRSRLHGLLDEDLPRFMLDSAMEHSELLGLVGDGSSAAASDLLARHISRVAAGWTTPG